MKKAEHGDDHSCQKKERRHAFDKGNKQFNSYKDRKEPDFLAVNHFEIQTTMDR